MNDCEPYLQVFLTNSPHSEKPERTLHNHSPFTTGAGSVGKKEMHRPEIFLYERKLKVEGSA